MLPSVTVLTSSSAKGSEAITRSLSCFFITPPLSDVLLRACVFKDPIDKLEVISRTVGGGIILKDGLFMARGLSKSCVDTNRGKDLILEIRLQRVDGFIADLIPAVKERW